MSVTIAVMIWKLSVH